MRLQAIVIALLGLISESGLSQERHWSSPDHLVIQHAGSIGYVSAGVGYGIFANRARTSFHYGYVPAATGGPLHIFSGKLMFVPGVLPVSRRVFINPFDAGLMLSYHAGSDFSSTWPSHRYPENYYWWKTAIRFHINVETSVTFRLRDHTTFKAATGYVEFNSNELYLVSLFQNIGSIGIKDVVKLGAGLRLHF